MRIGIDIRALQSTSRDRGIGYYVRGLLAGLAEVGGGHEYVLFALRGRELPSELRAGLRHEVVALPLVADTPWRRLWPIRYLRWLNPWHIRQRGMHYDVMLRRRLDRAWLAGAVRRERLDVLHLPSVFEPEFSATVGADFPCPVVQTVHDLIPEVFPEVNRGAGWWFWDMRAQGLRSLSEGPGRVVAISESARQDTGRLAPLTQGRVDVVFNGVAAHFSSPAEGEAACVSEKYGLCVGRYFLTNGGTEWRKNLPTALRAFAQFMEETPTTENFRIVVPGRLSEEDRALAAEWGSEAGLTPSQIIYTGFVADADLPGLYAGAAALVFPSRYEGFGLPVVEAMRCGCPVITAHNSSLPEVAGEAALMTDDADDVEGLAHFLQRVVREPGLADGLRARGRVQARRFSWEASARQYLGVYARAVQDARATGAMTVKERRVENRV